MSDLSGCVACGVHHELVMCTWASSMNSVTLCPPPWKEEPSPYPEWPRELNDIQVQVEYVCICSYWHIMNIHWPCSRCKLRTYCFMPPPDAGWTDVKYTQTVSCCPPPTPILPAPGWIHFGWRVSVLFIWFPLDSAELMNFSISAKIYSICQTVNQRCRKTAQRRCC